MDVVKVARVLWVSSPAEADAARRGLAVIDNHATRVLRTQLAEVARDEQNVRAVDWWRKAGTLRRPSFAVAARVPAGQR